MFRDKVLIFHLKNINLLIRLGDLRRVLTFNVVENLSVNILIGTYFIDKKPLISISSKGNSHH